jgi:hypothetical protein
MLIGTIIFLILICLIGGKELVKGLLSIAFGGILLLAGCAIV